HHARSMQAAVRFILGYLHGRNVGKVPDGLTATFELYADLEDSKPGRERVQEILKEANILPRGAKRRRLLLVDDRADQDGWHLALSVGLEDYQVQHIPYSGPADDELIHVMAPHADVALLDLRLPTAPGLHGTESVGLELLESMRKEHANLPVVMFSAHDDA